jgi:glycosyltransferase involved in cell wall biosynthesis
MSSSVERRVLQAGRPKVSILLCNYNDERYLPESLGAICQQTLAPDEVIVIDDGSTDDSIDIIEAVAAEFPFVRLLRNDRNQGLLPTVRRALGQASGDYVAWAAADDKLRPSFLERNLATLVQYPGAGVCFSRLAVFDDEAHAVREYLGDATTGPAFDLGAEPHFLTPQALRARLRRSYLWMSGNTVLARRDALFEAGGFRPELRWHADWFAYYVVALRYGACVVPETLALMRERAATFSRSGMARRQTQREVLRALAAALREPAYRDVAPAFWARPCLLSPFGRLMLTVLARDPRNWPLAWRYLQWTLDHQATIHCARAASSGNRRQAQTGRALRQSARLVDALTPSAWKN